MSDQRQLFKAGAVPDRMAFAGGPSVWLEFSPLARITGACNLGQGVQPISATSA